MTARLLLACAMLLAASQPLYASAAAEPATGPLPRGGTYVLQPDPSVAAAAVALWFRAPGAGYDDGSPGIARLAATAAAASKLASGKTLVELVHANGGEFTINVYPDLVGIDAVVPASAVRRVVAAMTAAYFAPAIDDTAVRVAQRDAAVLAVQQRFTPDLALHDLLFAHVFSSGPAHYPPLPDSIPAITRVATSDVAAFAKRAFRASNAILTLTGNVDVSIVGAVSDGDGNGPIDPPIDSTLARPAESTTATGAVDGLGLAWVGPPISDEKAATALDFIADYLFRDGTGVLANALEANNDDTYVSGQFITLHDPGLMLVTVDGSGEKAAKESILNAIAKLEQPMDARVFAAAREAFLYHIASDTQTPPELADNLGWYAAEGNASYAPGDVGNAYARTARALDPGFVASVVRRYLGNPVVVNLVTASAAVKGAAT